jgi:DNA helicase-2/ATP-dependent DNA helicase PcrA
VGDYAPQSGELISKEQYMITDGKIVFMAFESLEQARELIYQEYFSQRKSSFLLPEIVEQMEQAQDKVIRAHHQGSFLISGAAGSGKTTLALHRVAYLLQSPDTAERFKTENTIVFVQDNSLLIRGLKKT